MAGGCSYWCLPFRLVPEEVRHAVELLDAGDERIWISEELLVVVEQTLGLGLLGDVGDGAGDVGRDAWDLHRYQREVLFLPVLVASEHSGHRIGTMPGKVTGTLPHVDPVGFADSVSTVADLLRDDQAVDVAAGQCRRCLGGDLERGEAGYYAVS